MLRTSRTVAAPPEAVLRAIVAEADEVREPAEGHPNWKRRYSRVQVRQTGAEFRIRFVTRWTSGETGTPELRGSVASPPEGGSVVHATCGYGWYHAEIALGLLGVLLLDWVTAGSLWPWTVGMAAVAILAGKVEDARRAKTPDRYMLYLLRRLDTALEGVASGGLSSTETDTGEGADGCVGSRSV